MSIYLDLTKFYELKNFSSIQYMGFKDIDLKIELKILELEIVTKKNVQRIFQSNFTNVRRLTP